MTPQEVAELPVRDYLPDQLAVELLPLTPPLRRTYAGPFKLLVAFCAIIPGKCKRRAARNRYAAVSSTAQTCIAASAWRSW
jgi:hypothetical protein